MGAWALLEDVEGGIICSSCEWDSFGAANFIFQLTRMKTNLPYSTGKNCDLLDHYLFKGPGQTVSVKAIDNARTLELFHTVFYQTRQRSSPLIRDEH